jgi:hypothetical protein
MDGYKTLHDTLGSALQQAGEESGMLLGQELSISLADSLRTTKASYFVGLEDACFVIGVDSREAYAGQFYLIFSLRDSIVMSGTLLGIPPARIKEKQRLSIIETDDFDAFSEIGNMVNGSFNTVFQGTLPNKVHLKVLAPKKYIPDLDPLTEEEPLPDGEYLMFRSKLEMAGQEMNYLDVLIPVALGDLFDPPSEFEEPEAETQPLQLDESSDSNGQSPQLPTGAREAQESAEQHVSAEEGVETIVVLNDDEEECRRVTAAVGFTGYQILKGTLDADIKELFSGMNVRLVIIGSVDADDREIAVCIKVNAMRQDSPPPIIMIAKRWTRTAVLKALKYGARDILVLPCSEDEIASKVKRSCRLQ